jgi:hypothetical protein
MTFISQTQAQHYVAGANAIHCSTSGFLTVTSGYVNDDGRRRYFVLIDDRTLPSPYLYVERPQPLNA